MIFQESGRPDSRAEKRVPVHGDGDRQGQGGAMALLLQLLASGDMTYRGPTTVDVTLYFKRNTNKTLPKSAHHQFSDF